MSKSEKPFVTDFMSGSFRLSTDHNSFRRRNYESKTHQWSIAVGLVVVIALLIVCLLQCALVRLENNEMRLQIEQLQLHFVKQKNEISRLGVLPNVSGFASSEGHSERSRRSTDHQHLSAMHFVLDKEHLDNVIRRNQQASQSVDYSGSDIRWKQASLNSAHHHHQHQDIRSITVEETGVYFIYAQLTYYNAASKSAFNVLLNNRTLIKCLQSVDVVRVESAAAAAAGPFEGIFVNGNSRVKTCFTAGVFAMRANERLSIFNRNRAVLSDAHANFWGLLKL